MSAASDLRTLLAMEGGRETLKRRSRWIEEHGEAVLALIDAAQALDPIDAGVALAAAVHALTEDTQP